MADRQPPGSTPESAVPGYLTRPEPTVTREPGSVRYPPPGYLQEKPGDHDAGNPGDRDAHPASDDRDADGISGDRDADQASGRPATGLPRRSLLIAAGVLTMVLVLCAGVSVVIGANSIKPRSAIAHRIAAQQNIVEVGVPVRDGRLEFTVHGLDCGADRFNGVRGQLCVAALTVTDVGTDGYVFDPTDQFAFAESGNAYRANATTRVGTKTGSRTDTGINDIRPGGTLRTDVVFDVPTGSRIVRLLLHDSPLSDGAEVNVDR